MKPALVKYYWFNNCIDPPFHSFGRKFIKSQTLALVVRFFAPARKSCLPRDRARGMEAESTSGGSKEQLFSSIYRAYMHFFQCKKMRNGMTAMRLWLASVFFEDLR